MAKQSRIYTMWCNMKSRCYRKTSPDYKLYGERGIRVCSEWLNDSKAFISWANKNGYSDSLTIERIDTNKNYSPSNCKFITNEEQSLNRRTRADNKVGHRGINLTSDKRYYRVRLSVDGKRISVGDFKNLNDAVKAKEDFINLNKDKRICKEVLR